MAEQQLREAFELMKQGEKNQAMMVVRSVLRENRQNVDAWWLMANLLEDEDKILKSLNQVLELNPEHRGARKKLAELRPDLVENLAPIDDDKKKKSQYDWSKLDKPPQSQQQKTGKSFISQMIGIAITVFIFMGGPFLFFSVIQDNIPVEVQGSPPEEVARTQLNLALNGHLEEALAMTCDSLHDEWRDLVKSYDEEEKQLGLNVEFDFSKTEFEVIEQKARRTRIRLGGEIILRAGGEVVTMTYENLMAISDSSATRAEMMLIVVDSHWVVCSL